MELRYIFAILAKLNSPAGSDFRRRDSVRAKSGLISGMSERMIMAEHPVVAMGHRANGNLR